MALRILGWLSKHAESLAVKGCVAMGVFKGGDKLSPSFEQKFSDEQLRAMADSPRVETMTLKEVQDHFGVSYRQARKIKNAIEKALPVYHYAQNPQIA
ncbi:MAG: hypothetical protein V3T43_06235 [Nitrosomonadaceae bacterium]